MRRLGAADAEEGEEGLEGALVALAGGLAGGEGLDDAGAGQRGLLGDVAEEGGEAGGDALFPGLIVTIALDDAAQRLLDGEVLGGQKAVFL